ncbi:MAG: four helix bundle protein [Saprospiraceae bacterium]
MGNFRDLIAYQKAFKLAMDIFHISKTFPAEEKFSLTDQIRRASRSVCSCIGESYGKRRYPKHFISKLSDGDSENTETSVWADFAMSCKYITKEKYEYWRSETEEISNLLNYMMKYPEKYRK